MTAKDAGIVAWNDGYSVGMLEIDEQQSRIVAMSFCEPRS